MYFYFPCSDNMESNRSLILDPLSLGNEKSYKYILQFLSGAELLVLSEVSRGWYQLIAQSAEAMNKIQLVINENWYREFDINDLINSTRRYKHVKVGQLLRRRDHVFSLLWKYSYCLCSIDTYFDIKMRGLQMPFVRSLAIRKVRSCKDLNIETVFKDGLFSACKVLVKLEIAGETNCPETVINCLRSNENLKELIIDYNASHEIFAYYDHTWLFELKTLSMGKAFFASTIESNVCQFLSTQTASVQDLKVLHCDIQLLYKIFNAMKSLKSLTFSPVLTQVLYHDSFMTHDNLQEMKMIGVSMKYLEYMLPAAPNLKKLYISNPTTEMVTYVLAGTRALREFRYAFIEDGDYTNQKLLERYQDLKADSRYNVNRNIEIISQI